MRARPLREPRADGERHVVDDAGRVLLTRRGIEPASGCGTRPGGFIEAGEEPADARRGVSSARRPASPSRSGGVLGIYPDRYGDGAPTLNIFYTARVLGGGEGAPRDDVTEIGWFEPDALPGELAFPNGKRAVAEWRLWRAAQPATDL